jgi:DHA1 family bicyclomycin/chloramphenicol resistance-like MFS transporter
MLASLSALGPLSIDAYLPSIREIGREFAASPVLVQQTLTAYIVPFALMTLCRRRVTLLTLCVFFIGSLGCTLAWSIEALLFFRAVQGMTAGAGMVVGRAIVRDVLEGNEARRLMARVSLMFAIAPAAAPVIGGWLHVWFGWRSVFGFIVLFTGALLLWIARSLPETLDPRHRQPVRPRQLLIGYVRVMGTSSFVAVVLALAFSFMGIFLYIVSAPAFVLGLLKVGETSFLWLFGPITVGMLAGTWLSDRTASRLSNRRTVALAFAIMVVAALTNLVFHAIHAASVPLSVVPLVGYVVGSSLAMPSLTLMALDQFPHQRGMASSCQGFMQSGGNALTAAVIAPLLWGSAVSLALGQVTAVALSGSCFVGYLLVARVNARRAAASLALANGISPTESDVETKRHH